mgnify:CR=1 FL=1
MEFTVTMCDENLDKLAEAIASKINMNGTGAVEAAADDDFETETVKEISLTDMQDAIKEAVGTFGKDKIKAFVKKATGVDKVVDIPKEKYQTVLDGLKKVKK